MNPNPPLIIDVYVKPGVRKPRVGGEFDGRLVVAVAPPAADGQANAAVCAAVALALGLARGDVTIQAGAGSRRKRLAIRPDLDVSAAQVEGRLDRLRRG